LNSKAAHIVLVGLPGSGKSTMGKKLSDRLGYPFIDLDMVVEEKEGMSVPQLFSKKGEEYFREVESNCLRALLEAEQSFVLATGGGAPCFFNNMERIQQQTCSVYLEVSFEELALRLFAEGVVSRPLLQGVATQQELVPFLKEKFTYRLAYYQKAKLHFRNAAGAKTEDLLKEIQACLYTRS
jgi:shikimate kinase